jgi:hypothetical protein
VLVHYFNPNIVRGRTFHLEQSVSRQISRNAHKLDFGSAETADLRTNLVAVEI